MGVTGCSYAAQGLVITPSEPGMNKEINFPEIALCPGWLRSPPFIGKGYKSPVAVYNGPVMSIRRATPA